MTHEASRTSALSIRRLEMVYGGRGTTSHALRGIGFDVEYGEFVAIMGPSGSGKTTLLTCIGTLERPTSGEILIDGEDVTNLSRRRLAAFRRKSLGFVFQEANLIDNLTAFENIALALSLAGADASEISPRVMAQAEQLGVGDALEKFPAEMSGGQRQRVATARALVAGPRLLLADEPTGALDSHAAARLLEVFEDINAAGTTILMVSHDPFAASFASRVLFIRDGLLFNELRRGDSSQDAHYRRILELQAFLGGEANVR